MFILIANLDPQIGRRAQGAGSSRVAALRLSWADSPEGDIRTALQATRKHKAEVLRRVARGAAMHIECGRQEPLHTSLRPSHVLDDDKALNRH